LVSLSSIISFFFRLVLKNDVFTNPLDDNGNLWLVRNFGPNSQIYSIDKETGAGSLNATVNGFAAGAIAVPHSCPEVEEPKEATNSHSNHGSNGGKGKGKGKTSTALHKFLGIDE
jgi:hypothetical protein